MSAMKEIEITIQEVARIALEDPEMRSRIGHELDLSDEWMETVYRFVEGLLNAPDSAKTYKIIRFYKDQDNEEVMHGLTLEEAQEWCRRDDTHGEGWFDGYTEEV